MCRPLACTALHPCIASIFQLSALYLMGIVMVLCAYLGYAVTANVLQARSLLSLHSYSCFVFLSVDGAGTLGSNG